MTSENKTLYIRPERTSVTITLFLKGIDSTGLLETKLLPQDKICYI